MRIFVVLLLCVLLSFNFVQASYGIDVGSEIEWFGRAEREKLADVLRHMPISR